MIQYWLLPQFSQYNRLFFPSRFICTIEVLLCVYDSFLDPKHSKTIGYIVCIDTLLIKRTRVAS